jgi:hypothetical protein
MASRKRPAPARSTTRLLRRAVTRFSFASFASFAVSLTAFEASAARADSPFATAVVDFRPAPGQFVQDPDFNNPAAALGRPYASGFADPDNSSLVSLGGFGGSITLAFDHTVLDEPANPFGLDAIVYGNAFWSGGNPNRKWAEAGIIEISRDANHNGLADDPWYLIPGSHIASPAAQFAAQTWDDNWADPTWPPADPDWLPPGHAGVWTTVGFVLPTAIFGQFLIVNPNGLSATVEGIWGYADCSPTLKLGDLNGDNLVDDPNIPAEQFYTRPDDPLKVGSSRGSGGGDAFDIAWAVDETTGQPAQLDGFDFIRITTGVNALNAALGEVSTEIDAVADVAPGRMGDVENDGDIDADDFAVLRDCWRGPGAVVGEGTVVGAGTVVAPGTVVGAGTVIPTCPCRVVDFNGDGARDLRDFAFFQQVFGT